MNNCDAIAELNAVQVNEKSYAWEKKYPNFIYMVAVAELTVTIQERDRGAIIVL